MNNRWFCLTAVLCAGLTLSSCHKDLTDDAEEDSNKVILRYTIPAVVDFDKSIYNMRWLLYDSQGHYVRELDMQPRHRQTFELADMPDGQYTVINVGNTTDRTFFEHMESLDSLQLWANTRDEGGWYENVDCIYWQMRTFTLSDNGVTRVDMPLANSHCHLHVHVWWKGLPGRSGLWTMRLYDVSVNYYAGRQGQNIATLDHPLLGEATGEHRITVEPLNFELDGEFVVFRWTDSHVPKLQIWCNDEAASPLIDLGKVFGEWHWSPDRTVAQDYYLDVQINDDGSADVSTWGRGRIADWVDGGVIGN